MTTIPIHAVTDANLRDYAVILATERLHNVKDIKHQIEYGLAADVSAAYASLMRLNGNLMMRCRQFELLLHEKNVQIETLKARLKAKGKNDDKAT